MDSIDRKWWKEANAYQVWPTSFADSTGSGIGDLLGLISKLDHLVSLSIDVLWLSPCFQSPQADYGYDISDYREVDGRYGTMEDMELLIREAHKRGIKVLLDLVLNHSSDQHAWFKESRASLVNPKRDWYIWKKGTVDSETGERRPPNNWASIFGGGAWEYDEGTDEWYLHTFLTAQPELNWECDELRETIHDVCRFWLDKGADGFRMDACTLLSKPLDFPDMPIVDPASFFQPNAWDLCTRGPRIHEFFQEMHAKVFSHYDEPMIVGETGGDSSDMDRFLRYIQPESKEMSCLFNFELTDLDGVGISERAWSVPQMGDIVARWQQRVREVGGWNTVFLENHDLSRSIERFASKEPRYRARSAKLLATFFLSLSGTPFIYQGQELGLVNLDPSWTLEDFSDPASLNFYHSKKAELRKEFGEEEPDMADVLALMRRKARDAGRTPMQWTPGKNAGFSEGEPWCKIPSDYPEWNAETQSSDPSSVLSFYRLILAMRKQYPVLIHGSYTPLSPTHAHVLSYLRACPGLGPDLLIVLNCSAEAQRWEVPKKECGAKKAELLLGTMGGEGRVEDGWMELEPWEGRIYSL